MVGIGCGVADAAGSDLTDGGGDGEAGGNLASSAGLISAVILKVTIFDLDFGVLALPVDDAVVFIAPAIVLVKLGWMVVRRLGVEAIYLPGT